MANRTPSQRDMYVGARRASVMSQCPSFVLYTPAERRFRVITGDLPMVKYFLGLQPETHIICCYDSGCFVPLTSPQFDCIMDQLAI